MLQTEVIGDVEDWKGKPNQLVSELFAVGTEIFPEESISESLQLDSGSDDFVG